MAAATTTAGRAIRRQICGKHGVEYGQVLDPGIPGQRESVWLPPDCPKCEVELRQKLEADAEVARVEQELIEETNRRAETDAGRDERIDAAVEAEMREYILQYVAEFYATQRAAFENYHNGRDWDRMYQQVRAERRDEFVERMKKAGG